MSKLHAVERQDDPEATLIFQPVKRKSGERASVVPLTQRKPQRESQTSEAGEKRRSVASLDVRRTLRGLPGGASSSTAPKVAEIEIEDEPTTNAAPVTPVPAAPVPAAIPQSRIPTQPPELDHSAQDAKDAPAAKPKSALAMRFNNLIVSAYKVAGFGILSLILFGLVSYLAVDAFYYVNQSWATPTILSPTDERVIKLNSELAQEQSARDKLAADLRDVTSRIEEEERTAVAEEGFQKSFELAVSAEYDDAADELSQLRKVATNYGAVHGEVINTSSGATAELSKARLQQLLAAHVIDADGMAKGSLELAKVANAGAVTAERGAEVGSKVAQLNRRVASLGQAKGALSPADVGKVGEYSYEVLQLKHLYDRSVLESERARHNKDVLVKNQAEMQEGLNRYDRLIKALQDAPYLMAADKSSNMAFVPYDNTSRATVGAPVYACRIAFLICRKVGKVERILDGEVTGRHPLHNQDLRGEMVRLTLDDPSVAKQAVLHIGRAPAFL